MRWRFPCRFWQHGEEGGLGGTAAPPSSPSGVPAAFSLPLHMKSSGVWGLLKVELSRDASDRGGSWVSRAKESKGALGTDVRHLSVHLWQAHLASTSGKHIWLTPSAQDRRGWLVSAARHGFSHMPGPSALALLVGIMVTIYYLLKSIGQRQQGMPRGRLFQVLDPNFDFSIITDLF